MLKLIIYISLFLPVTCLCAIDKKLYCSTTIESPSIADFLNINGTLNLTDHFTGSLNLEGFEVLLDNNTGIIAIPRTHRSFSEKFFLPPISGTWSALGSGLDGNGFCYSVAISGNIVYAGGNFMTAGGNLVNNIAKWDGNSWSALSTGLNGRCLALTLLGNDLIAGGEFTLAGGTGVNYIAKWDGNSWSALSIGVNSSCFALAADNSGNLLAGGSFWEASGIPAAGIAKWDGNSWSALGTGLNGHCYTIAFDNSGNLYAAGFFSSPGNNIAKWDGNSWSPLGTGILGDACYAITTDNAGNLYAAGLFSSPGNNIAKWDGNSWSPLGTGLPGNGCWALSFDFNTGNLYAGGWFTIAGGNPANYIANWDGNSWSPLGTGLNSFTGVFNSDAIVIGSDGIYVGGNFTTAGGNIAYKIAKWEPTPLPVELVNFNCISTKSGIYVQWQTSTETNNLGFYIERSENGTNWLTISFIEGAGTSIETISYNYFDSTPQIGANYYRLKQVDYDGQFKFSNIINVRYQNENLHVGEFYPNPNHLGVIYLDNYVFKDEVLDIIVYNEIGELVFHQKYPTSKVDNKLKLDFSYLERGLYFVKIGSQRNHLYRKIILEK